MAKRESFLLRVDPALLAAIRKWSDDEMRSINGQLEYLLRDALLRAGRLKPKSDSAADDADSSTTDESREEEGA